MTAGRRQLIRDELEEGLIVSADVPSKLLDTVMRDWSMARAWLLLAEQAEKTVRLSYETHMTQHD